MMVVLMVVVVLLLLVMVLMVLVVVSVVGMVVSVVILPFGGVLVKLVESVMIETDAWSAIDFAFYGVRCLLMFTVVLLLGFDF